LSANLENLIGLSTELIKLHCF